MKIAIPKEIEPHEQRVAATPETVKKMVLAGLTVIVEAHAGKESAIPDTAYQDAGATLAHDRHALFQQAEIILKVQKPNPEEISSFEEGALLISFIHPLIHVDLVKELAHHKINTLAMDMIPRIARAQKLDALSSQSNVSGYKAVLMAANTLGKFMPMMMTAAGTVTPAKVFVIGAGVAGLQAIATAKRLGAVVEAFDTRPIVKEQVESLGAKFIALEMKEETEDKSGYAKEVSEETHKRELELIFQHAKNADVLITTAQIPGKPSPVLITEETVRAMKPGSVIVDLAVEGGGNCALTESGRDVVKYGVTIIGRLNVPSLMATQSSQLYARNIMNFLFEVYKNGQLNLDLSNEVVKGALITHEGKIVHFLVQDFMKRKGGGT